MAATERDAGQEKQPLSPQEKRRLRVEDWMSPSGRLRANIARLPEQKKSHLVHVLTAYAEDIERVYNAIPNGNITPELVEIEMGDPESHYHRELLTENSMERTKVILRDIFGSRKVNGQESDALVGQFTRQYALCMMFDKTTFEEAEKARTAYRNRAPLRIGPYTTPGAQRHSRKTSSL